MNGTYEHLAVCPYCGQVVQVEMTKSEPTEAELADAAVAACACFEAQRKAERKKRLEEASNTIQEMFGTEEEAMLRVVIYNAVELLVDGKVEAVQINIGYGCAVKIKNKRDKVWIIKTRRASCAEEV